VLSQHLRPHPEEARSAVSKDGQQYKSVTATFLPSKKCGIGLLRPIAQNYFKYKMIADRALPDALDFFEPLIPK
jgi:hypothetical protein